MAENKQSFLLYRDIIHTVELLPNIKKGILFQFILEYVNDRNPKIEDREILLVFEPIKQNLKQALIKWNSIKEKRSEAGQISALKRQISKLKADQKPTKSTSVESVNKDKGVSTNPTVNVNDSVIVNVTVNDILLKKETKKLFGVWVDYRKEIKKPIKSEKTFIALAKRIKREGDEKSKQVILQSIENGWQGLFWNKIYIPKPSQKTDASTIILQRYGFSKV